LFSFLFYFILFHFWKEGCYENEGRECAVGGRGAGEKKETFSVPTDVGTWNCRLPVVVVVLCVSFFFYFFDARVSLISLFHSGNTPPTPFKKIHWRPPQLPHRKTLLSLRMSTAA
jgi:hypothetical protein